MRVLYYGRKRFELITLNTTKELSLITLGLDKEPENSIINTTYLQDYLIAI